jgi:hypothetical protein
MTIREMLDQIGQTTQYVTLRIVGEEASTSGNQTQDAVWYVRKQPRCKVCGEPFDDGEQIILQVRVEESEFAPGKPGCSEKRCYHEECAPPALARDAFFS